MNPSSAGRWWRAIALVVSTTLVLVLLAVPASATWSIVAVDPETGEVGVAMAGCGSAAALGEAGQVLDPIVLVPGRGAGVVQGTIRPEAIEEMESLVAGGADSAAVVVQTLVDADDEALAAVRQYGVVLVDDTGDQAGLHSGAETAAVALALAADNVTVQGVGVADRVVVEQSLAAFVAARSEGRAVTDALADGLSAGADAGGDAACGQQTALFAQLAVADSSDGNGRTPTTVLTVTVDEGDGQNPVSLLADANREGERGWIDAGVRSPTFVPRWLVLAVAVAVGVAAVVVIRRGMAGG